MTLTDFARLNAMQNQMEEARPYYEEALKIDRQLAQRSPAIYLPNLAMTLDSLGRVDQLQSRIDESRVHYAEAMTIYQTLSEGDAARYSGYVSRVEASLRELEGKGQSRH
jgi:tetratricopeptide (TPR) repeat protein